MQNVNISYLPTKRTQNADEDCAIWSMLEKKQVSGHWIEMMSPAVSNFKDQQKSYIKLTQILDILISIFLYINTSISPSANTNQTSHEMHLCPINYEITLNCTNKYIHNTMNLVKYCRLVVKTCFSDLHKFLSLRADRHWAAQKYKN